MRTFNQILDEDGFIGDIRNRSSEIQEFLDEYSTPMLAKTNTILIITDHYTVLLSATCWLR